jgi:hypothetical protein
MKKPDVQRSNVCRLEVFLFPTFTEGFPTCRHMWKSYEISMWIHMTRYFITLWYLFMSSITYPVLGVLSKRHKHSAHIIFKNCIVLLPSLCHVWLWFITLQWFLIHSPYLNHIRVKGLMSFLQLCRRIILCLVSFHSNNAYIWNCFLLADKLLFYELSLNSLTT